jgi:hypothetical protein
MSAPSPIQLWYQADEEHPDNPVARSERYMDLMREHGHVEPRKLGDDSPLFPCGYDPRLAP